MTAATVPARAHGLVVGDANEIDLHAARVPHLSVIQWLAAAGAPRGAQSAFASSVALATPPNASRIASALGQPGLTRLPEYLVPLAPRDDTSIADTVTALRDAPAALLAEEIASWPGDLLPGWRSAVDEPRRWRDDFADAVEAAWRAGRRTWDASGHALDRELARIGTAAVTGAVPALLNSLHPRLSYADGVIRFKGSCSSSIPLAGRRLVLVPSLAPPHRVVVSFERADITYITYPVLGRGRPRRRGGDRLEAVVGQVRAAALRALVVPLTMQTLAGRIHCAASTATYHCDLLESAGLVARERRGPAVWVMRTRDGDQLVDLLS